MKRKILIWLDDERVIPDRWLQSIGYPDVCDVVCCKTGEHCIEWLDKHANEYRIWIAFDHDLGYGITGYDVAKYIVENQIAIEGFSCHSMNPVGVKNILGIMTHYGYQKTKSLGDIYYG